MLGPHFIDYMTPNRLLALNAWPRLMARGVFLGLALAWLGTVGSAVAAEPSAPLDLSGKVTSQGGQAIANAHVFIYTAGPRVGASPI
jgi:hypothetical protein